MTPTKTTFYATATINGAVYTDSRTSARPYTHAAFHATGNPAAIAKGKLYYATFHSSAALAQKSGLDVANGATVAVVEISTTKPAPQAAEPVETAGTQITIPGALSAFLEDRDGRLGEIIAEGRYGLRGSLSLRFSLPDDVEAWDYLREAVEVLTQTGADASQAERKAARTVLAKMAELEPQTASPAVAEPVPAAAPAPNTNKRSTKHVISNLTKWYREETGEQGWQTQEVWERLSSTSMEDFRDQAMRYLGDRSNLSRATLKAADWAHIFDYFHNRPETTDADLEAAADTLRKVNALPELSITGEPATTPETAPEELMEVTNPTSIMTFGSSSELGGNLTQIILKISGLITEGCTGLRIESGPLAGVEDALMAAAPALAEVHRGQLSARVSAGLAQAAAEGRKGGRRRAVDDDTLKELKARVERGETIPAAAKALGIKRATAYRMMA